MQNHFLLVEFYHLKSIANLEKIETALYHTRLMIEDKGEKIAIPESRKHISWYLRGMRGNAPVRVAINHATKYDELEKILNEYAKYLV